MSSLPSPATTTVWQGHACGRQGRRWERLTGDRRHPGFHGGYQVTCSSVEWSMTKLVLPARRCHTDGDCTRVSFSRRRHQNIAAQRHGYSEAAGTSCLRQLRWWISEDRNKAQRVVCLLFSTSRLHSSHSRSTVKAFIASPAETGRRSQQLSSCLAAGLGHHLPDYTVRYRDTLAYDIAIQFFLTIRALHYSNYFFNFPS